MWTAEKIGTHTAKGIRAYWQFKPRFCTRICSNRSGGQEVYSFSSIIELSDTVRFLQKAVDLEAGAKNKLLATMFLSGTEADKTRCFEERIDVFGGVSYILHIR